MAQGGSVSILPIPPTRRLQRCRSPTLRWRIEPLIERGRRVESASVAQRRKAALQRHMPGELTCIKLRKKQDSQMP